MNVEKSESGYWHLVSKAEKDYRLTPQNNYPFKGEDLDFYCKSSKIYGPSRIEYVGNPEEISNEAIRLNPKHKKFKLFEIDLNSIGLKKLISWSFEREYRYRIIFPDIKFMAGSEQLLENYNCLYKEKFVDISFNYDKVDNFEILLGPLVTPMERKDLELKLSKIDKKFSIIESVIKIK